MSTISGKNQLKISITFYTISKRMLYGVTVMYISEVDAKIKQLRVQRGLSQTALAKQLGVSKSVVSSYETGVHLPPYDMLIQLAQLFSVSTDYLLGLSGNHAINVDGLTDTQIKAVSTIVDELKRTNKL